jgi:hypothetical protein
MLGATGLPVTWEEFALHYCDTVPDSYVGWRPVGVRNVEELAAGLRPYFLRRTACSLGLPLPALDIRRVQVEPPAGDMARAMAGMRNWTPERLISALEANDDLRDQDLAGARRAIGIAKAALAAAHVADLLAAEKTPMVAFFQHTDVRTEMHRLLRKGGLACSWIDGKVTKAQFRATTAWFDAGRLDALLVQTQAGGVGLTLTAAHRAVVAELPWTSAALDQQVKRIHRISQEKDCTADILSARGCWLDDIMAATVSRKRRASDALMALLTTNN